jgi:hypothetical protein
VIGDSIVVDTVVHPYHLAPGNQNSIAREQLETVYAAQRLSFDPGHARYVLTHQEFFPDFAFEAVALWRNRRRLCACAAGRAPWALLRPAVTHGA